MAHLYFMPATHPQTSAVLLCVITLLPRNSGDQRCGCTSERRGLWLELIQSRRSSTRSQGLEEEQALHRPCKCSTGALAPLHLAALGSVLLQAAPIIHCCRFSHRRVRENADGGFFLFFFCFKSHSYHEPGLQSFTEISRGLN